MLTGQSVKCKDANKQIKIKKSLWITASNDNDLIFDEDEGQLKVFSIVNNAVLSIWDILVAFYFKTCYVLIVDLDWTTIKKENRCWQYNLIWAWVSLKPR